jgi:putative DNA methylase
MGKKKKQLAEQDYERKMAAAFREMQRILHPDGVLTVMFTHKRVEAWDTLAMALIGAGFEIRASWPVHTESEHSLHQAKKNSAASTILLACRKRVTDASEPVWWEDLQGRVRETARIKLRNLPSKGCRALTCISPSSVPP